MLLEAGISTVGREKFSSSNTKVHGLSCCEYRLAVCHPSNSESSRTADIGHLCIMLSPTSPVAAPYSPSLFLLINILSPLIAIVIANITARQDLKMEQRYCSCQRSCQHGNTACSTRRTHDLGTGIVGHSSSAMVCYRTPRGSESVQVQALLEQLGKESLDA